MDRKASAVQMFVCHKARSINGSMKLGQAGACLTGDGMQSET